MRRISLGLIIISALFSIFVTAFAAPYRGEVTNPLYVPLIALSEATAGPTSTATIVASMTPTLQPTAQATITPTIPAAGSLVNGDFELGLGVGWSTENNAQVIVPPAPFSARSGALVAFFTDGGDDFRNGRSIVQTVTIPQDNPILHFWTRVNSTESSCSIERLIVGARRPGDSMSINIDRPVCRSTTSNEWIELTVDFTPYAGETVSLQFTFLSFNTNVNSVIIVDDVGFQAVK